MSGEAVEKLRELWAEAFAGAVEAMAGERPKLTWMTAEAGLEEPLLWWEQSLNLCAQPAAWVGAPESALRLVGGRVLAAAGMEEASAEDLRATWTELLTQTFSGLAQKLGAIAGENIALSSGRILPEAPEAGKGARLQIRLEEGEAALMQVGFSEALAKLLESWFHAAGAGAELGKSESGEAPVHGYKTLELLKDVELPVSVSFGRTQMALQDVLKLSAGSIIELDRTIDEPVALIVNDTVVALGEVVVIEGNYGLRIQKIMSREDLLRTSGIR
jgi:flagellar motor switch protein FliN/FliY